VLKARDIDPVPYPALVHARPTPFGEDNTASLTGLLGLSEAEVAELTEQGSSKLSSPASPPAQPADARRGHRGRAARGYFRVRINPARLRGQCASRKRHFIKKR
jgi:hypothetical protein